MSAWKVYGTTEEIKADEGWVLAIVRDRPNGIEIGRVFISWHTGMTIPEVREIARETLRDEYATVGLRYADNLPPALRTLYLGH